MKSSWLLVGFCIDDNAQQSSLKFLTNQITLNKSLLKFYVTKHLLLNNIIRGSIEGWLHKSTSVFYIVQDILILTLWPWWDDVSQMSLAKSSLYHYMTLFAYLNQFLIGNTLALMTDTYFFFCIIIPSIFHLRMCVLQIYSHYFGSPFLLSHFVIMHLTMRKKYFKRQWPCYRILILNAIIGKRIRISFFSLFWKIGLS